MAITSISTQTAITPSMGPMKPTRIFMDLSFPKMEEITFRRNFQGTSKVKKIARVRQLKCKAGKGGHKQKAAGRPGCSGAPLRASQGEITLQGRSKLKKEDKAGF